MSYTLHLHPLSSFCWKVLTAFYDTGTPFKAVTVDLQDSAKRTAYLSISPLGKIPALVDHARGVTVLETSVIVEYLAIHEPQASQLVPRDPLAALAVRELDRFFDFYLQGAMQKIVLDNLRPEGSRDPFGVQRARDDMTAALDVLERRLPATGWATGASFTLADCSACPALYYANRVAPFEKSHPNVARYLARLQDRPSFARVLVEAEPFFAMFPGDRK